jgi:hypothetical protein
MIESNGVVVIEFRQDGAVVGGAVRNHRRTNARVSIL